MALNIGKNQQIRRRQRPFHFSVVQDEFIDLQPAMEQGMMVESDLDFANGEGGADFRLNPAQADVFRNDTPHDPPADPGEFQLDAMRADRLQDPGLDEIWQANLVHPIKARP